MRFPLARGLSATGFAATSPASAAKIDATFWARAPILPLLLVVRTRTIEQLIPRLGIAGTNQPDGPTLTYFDLLLGTPRGNSAQPHHLRDNCARIESMAVIWYSDETRRRSTSR